MSKIFINQNLRYSGRSGSNPYDKGLYDTNRTGTKCRFYFTSDKSFSPSTNQIWYPKWDSIAQSRQEMRPAYIVSSGGWLKCNYLGVLLMQFSYYCTGASLSNYYIFISHDNGTSTIELLQGSTHSAHQILGSYMANVLSGDLIRIGLWTIAGNTYVLNSTTYLTYLDVALFT